MTRVTIYHNPECSKSRAALALLRERGIAPEIVEYLRRRPARRPWTRSSTCWAWSRAR